MSKPVVAVILLSMALAPPASAQRRGAGGRVTFVVAVSNAAGTPLSQVKVTLSGPASRTTRTERGRAVFEDVPAR
jgi:hypothetical protein